MFSGKFESFYNSLMVNLVLSTSLIHRFIKNHMRENMAIELLIEEKLVNAFSPLHIDITKEKLLFDLPNAEQFHFNVIIISSLFEGLRIKQRHQAINSILAKELIENIPVLTLHTYTEKEWLYKYSSLPFFISSNSVNRETA